MAFQEDVDECDDQVEGDTYENLIKSISLLAKIFIKVMVRLDRRFKRNVTTNV